MAKTSPGNLGELVFLESQKGLTIIIQNNFVKFDCIIFLSSIWFVKFVLHKK